MKKLMILGAAASQVPLISAAKRPGYETIVPFPEIIRTTYADVCCYADISCRKRSLQRQKSWNIDGITTCGMDTASVPLAVCDELGLWGISIKQPVLLSDKYLSKLAFLKKHIPVQKHFRYGPKKNCLEYLFPITYSQAVDLMGSRGIYRCNTREERAAFSNAMKSTSRDYLPGGGTL